MRIAIYGRALKKEDVSFLQGILDEMNLRSYEILFHKDYYKYLNVRNYLKADFGTFSDSNDLKDVDYLFTIGGDGTLLDTVSLVKDSNLPIMGINTGRLGFLSSTSREKVIESLSILENKKYELDVRSLLEVSSNKPFGFEMNIGLNEFTIQKQAAAQMVVIHTYLDDQFLNSYWADGVILATPTGSTAYNLSCGGPIIHPQSNNFVITPVAAHNLNVRPFVISDQSEVRFEIEGRSDNFVCSLDSNSSLIDSEYKVSVRKADFSINLLRLPEGSFLEAIRSKLNWGLDKRN